VQEEPVRRRQQDLEKDEQIEDIGGDESAR
jgi:hypothetical protein